jgi:hypothetical protein
MSIQISLIERPPTTFSWDYGPCCTCHHYFLLEMVPARYLKMMQLSQPCYLCHRQLQKQLEVCAWMLELPSHVYTRTVYVGAYQKAQPETSKSKRTSQFHIWEVFYPLNCSNGWTFFSVTWNKFLNLIELHSTYHLSQWAHLEAPSVHKISQCPSINRG